VTSIKANNVNVPVINKVDPYDLQIVSYVAGFLVKKLKILNCEECAANLLTDIMEPRHTYTSFREYSDNKKRLFYVTEAVSHLLERIFDIVIYILPDYGHISNITKKLQIYIMRNVNFDWFSCKEHFKAVFDDFLKYSIHLVIKKYLDDIYRSSQEKKRSQLSKKKKSNILHL
jgi:hypothetical protein